jgi:hypothetical protein
MIQKRSFSSCRLDEKSAVGADRVVVNGRIEMTVLASRACQKVGLARITTNSHYSGNKGEWMRDLADEGRAKG